MFATLQVLSIVPRSPPAHCMANKADNAEIRSDSKMSRVAKKSGQKQAQIVQWMLSFNQLTPHKHKCYTDTALQDFFILLDLIA